MKNQPGVLMSETIQLGEIAIAVTRKDIKHVHLSVHPPDGRVTLVAPLGTRLRSGPRLCRVQARVDYGASRRSCGGRRGRRRASSSSVKANIFGAGGTC